MFWKIRAKALLAGSCMLWATCSPAFAETADCNGVSGEALQIDRVWRGTVDGGPRGKDFILQIDAGQAPSLRIDADSLRADTAGEEAQPADQAQQVQQAPVEWNDNYGTLELTILSVDAGRPTRRRLFPPAQQFDGLLAGEQQFRTDTLDGTRFFAPSPGPGCYLVRLISPQSTGEAELLVRPHRQAIAAQTVQVDLIALGAEQQVNLTFGATEAFLFEGRQGQRVRIELTGPENAEFTLDPTVSLLGLANPPASSGAAVAATGWSQVDFNDDGPGSLNSRLDVTLPFNGLFAIAPASINGEGAATLKLSGGEMARLNMTLSLAANSQWVEVESAETYFALPAGVAEIQSGGDIPFDLGIDNPLSPGSFISLQSALPRPDGTWSIALSGNRPRNLVIRMDGAGQIRACRAACPAVVPDDAQAMQQQ